MGENRIVHCWEEYREETGEFDGFWPVEKAYSCLLENGHDGPHEFTADSDIMVHFA